METTREEKRRQLVLLEWKLFQQVHNEGGRASCQEDPETFFIMRSSQFAPWGEDLLDSWYRDLLDGEAEGRNLLAEKYAWMMARTAPREFEGLRSRLREPTEEALAQIDRIVALELKGMEQYRAQYPCLAGGNRPLRSAQDGGGITSFETYLWGELHTYSLHTLRLYRKMAEELDRAGTSLTMAVMEHMVEAYGYRSLEEAERHEAIRRTGRGR